MINDCVRHLPSVVSLATLRLAGVHRLTLLDLLPLLLRQHLILSS